MLTGTRREPGQAVVSVLYSVNAFILEYSFQTSLALPFIFGWYLMRTRWPSSRSDRGFERIASASSSVSCSANHAAVSAGNRDQTVNKTVVIQTASCAQFGIYFQIQILIYIENHFHTASGLIQPVPNCLHGNLRCPLIRKHEYAG